jgi:hypothetical protein
MWHLVVNALIHSSVLLLTLFCLWRLNHSLAAIRKQVETILHASTLWSGGKWEVVISELHESSMLVRITLGSSDPEIAFQLKSYVQEHIVDYLNQFKKGSLIGAVADQKPATEVAERINSQKPEPAASTSGEA